MATTTGLYGSYSLTTDSIDKLVRGMGPGAYLLGHMNADGTLKVRYAGRSDSDLNSRLKDWLGSYPAYQFGFCETAVAAFFKECWLFHTFGGYSLDNTVHPARPKGSAAKCPHCTALG